MKINKIHDLRSLIKRIIINNLDRELFNTYGDLWLDKTLFSLEYKLVLMIPYGHYEFLINADHAKILS